METKPEIREFDVNTLVSLLDKIEAVLGEDVATPFRQLLHCYSYLLEIIRKKDISIRKLQHILFGAKTERSSNVLGKDHASSAEDGTSSQEGKAAKEASSAERNDQEKDCGQRRPHKPGRGDYLYAQPLAKAYPVSSTSGSAAGQ